MNLVYVNQLKKHIGKSIIDIIQRQKTQFLYCNIKTGCTFPPKLHSDRAK